MPSAAVCCCPSSCRPVCCLSSPFLFFLPSISAPHLLTSLSTALVGSGFLFFSFLPVLPTAYTLPGWACCFVLHYIPVRYFFAGLPHPFLLVVFNFFACFFLVYRFSCLPLTFWSFTLLWSFWKSAMPHGIHLEKIVRDWRRELDICFYQIGLFVNFFFFLVGTVISFQGSLFPQALMQRVMDGKQKQSRAGKLLHYVLGCFFFFSGVVGLLGNGVQKRLGVELLLCMRCFLIDLPVLDRASGAFSAFGGLEVTFPPWRDWGTRAVCRSRPHDPPPAKHPPVMQAGKARCWKQLEDTGENGKKKSSPALDIGFGWAWNGLGALDPCKLFFPPFLSFVFLLTFFRF